MNKLIKLRNKFLSIGILLTLLLSPLNVAQASDSQCKAVTAILVGEVAVCSGYIFSFDAEQWAREEREYNLKIIENYKQQNSVLRSITYAQDERIQAHVEYEQALQTELEQRKKANMYWGVGGVVAGVLLTSLIISNTK